MVTNYPELLTDKLKGIVDGTCEGKDIGIISEFVPLAEGYFTSNGISFEEVAEDTAYIIEKKPTTLAKLFTNAETKYARVCIGNPVGIDKLERMKYPVKIIWYSVAPSQAQLDKREEHR